jgi:hypothetical protein
MVSDSAGRSNCGIAPKSGKTGDGRLLGISVTSPSNATDGSEHSRDWRGDDNGQHEGEGFAARPLQ